jgi:hypothetical protein
MSTAQTSSISRARTTRAVSTRGLQWRDCFLLPLIFLGTIAVLLIGGEVTTRFLYPQADDSEPCEYATSNGLRYHPFCVSHSKVWEGPWITQRFNDCGYRSSNSCGPLPAGSVRVDVMGSSTSRGALVNYRDFFAAEAAKSLSQACGHLVDFQAMGTEPIDVGKDDKRIPEALALKPTAIILAITTYDLEHLRDLPPATIGLADAEPSFNWHGVVALLRDSRLFLLMQSYLYRDPDFQIRSFLLNGDPADYIRTPLSPAWQKRVADLGDLLARITVQTKPAGVPVLLLYAPSRSQAAVILRRGKVPSNVDPFVLQRALASAASHYGVTLLDATPDFAAMADFNSDFYLSDGHPREGGHVALAETVERGLLHVPAFAACHRGNGS